MECGANAAAGDGEEEELGVLLVADAALKAPNQLEFQKSRPGCGLEGAARELWTLEGEGFLMFPAGVLPSKVTNAPNACVISACGTLCGAGALGDGEDAYIGSLAP